MTSLTLILAFTSHPGTQCLVWKDCKQILHHTKIDCYGLHRLLGGPSLQLAASAGSAGGYGLGRVGSLARKNGGDLRWVLGRSLDGGQPSGVP